MKEFVKDYFVNAAKELGETILEYLNNAKCNYVILEGEDVVVWRKENTPVIFGSMDDIAEELSNWATPIKNISILTEQDFITKYCGKEMDIALIAEKKAQDDSDENMLTYFMNPYNSHSKELVLKINRLWKKDMLRFEPILVALYKRDIDEIYDADSFASLPDNKDAALSVLIVNWSNHAYNYLMHIADDGDLETIIDFIRVGSIGKEDAEPKAEYFVRRKYNGSVDEEYVNTTKAGAIEELRDYYIHALNDEMGNTCADRKVVESHYEEESAYIVLRDGTKIEWEIDWDGE